MALHKGGHPESNSEYGKSLSRIAKEVDKLVMYDSGMNHFRDCIRPFGKRWNDHISGFERERQKRKQHWEKVKLNPKWQDKNAEPPKKNWEWDLFYLGNSSLSETVIVDGKVRHRGPEYEMPASLGRKYVTAVKKYIQRNKKENKQRNSNDLESTISHKEGQIAKIQSQLKELSAEQIETVRIEANWGWWRYLDMSEEEVFGCWRPPIKIWEDPFSRLQPGFDRLTGEVEGLPEPKNKAEEYERYYVYLTSVHDNMLAGCGKINNDIWPEQLSEQVWSLFKWEGRYGPDIPFIEAALERVKADPAKKPAEIQQSQQAQTPPEIELMRQLAKRLRNTADQLTMLKRNYSGIFAGSEMDIHKVVVFLRLNRPSVADQVQGEWHDITSLAKEIDQLIIGSSKAALEKATSRHGSLRYNLYRLAETLEDTSRNMATEKEAEPEQEVKTVKKPQRKYKKKKQKLSKSINKRFTFRQGQVLFDGQDLNVGAGVAVEILKALVRNFGCIVPFKELDENSLQTDASEKTRTAIRRIRKTLKSAKISVVVENRKAEGYIMLPTSK